MVTAGEKTRRDFGAENADKVWKRDVDGPGGGGRHGIAVKLGNGKPAQMGRFVENHPKAPPKKWKNGMVPESTTRAEKIFENVRFHDEPGRWHFAKKF